MNQSAWFSIDDDKMMTHLPHKGSSQKKKPKVIENLIIDMPTILDNLAINVQCVVNNLLKYPIKADGTKQCLKNSTVRVLCEERDCDGKLVNPERQLNQITRISMASSIPIIQGLKWAFLSMCEGDEAWFKISNEQLYSQNEIDSGMVILETHKYYKITMLSVVSPAPMIDSNTLENRIEQLKKFREDGKNFHSRELYDTAISRYKKAINFLDKWPKALEDDPNCQKIKKWYYIIYAGNMAQCYMDLKMYKEASTILEDIVGQARNTEFELKNYYRLVKCLVALDEGDLAMRHIKEARHLCKIDQVTQVEFNQLEKKCKC